MSDSSDDESGDGIAAVAQEVGEEDISSSEENDEEDDDGDDDDDDDSGTDDAPQAAEATEDEDEDDDDDEDEDDDEEDESVAVVAEDGPGRMAADDNDEVMAAVVVDDDDDDAAVEEVGAEVEAVAVAVPAEIVSETTQALVNSAAKSKPKSESQKKSKSKSRPKTYPPPTTSSSSAEQVEFAEISPTRLAAAEAARSMLGSTVSRLPFQVDDSFTVRSFGQLHLEGVGAPAKFSSANALYPVGYSCDKYEFSPIHGRLLKLRCSILDGGQINKMVQSRNLNPSEPPWPRGPIFRVMWGRGVDEDAESVKYPYDLYSQSSPISSSNNVDVVAIPTTVPHRSTGFVYPEKGMRVKVRFEDDQYYEGTVTQVEEIDDSASQESGSRPPVNISIHYDDGANESAVFPDPDIALLMPGVRDQIDDEGNVELKSLNGKPVQSVTGSTPLDAWSKFLMTMGIVDEIMVDSAMEAVQAAREDGLAEAREKFDARSNSRKKSAQDPSGAQGALDNGNPMMGSPASQLSAGFGSSQGGFEAPSSIEMDLRRQVDALKYQLATAKAADRVAATSLADARIELQGKFLCNPFKDMESNNNHLSSWLSTAIRKEKSKMGSTGNKRKKVNAADLLERNNTFFNPNTEALIEGLPGSEYCSSYIFQSSRASGAASISRAWMHEAELRQERDKEKKAKQTKENKVKTVQQKEKEMKRKAREDERDARKRQRLEEEDQKKKARTEERLTRLNMQVDERLSKEACFQREKVILIMAKNLTREFARRRKAAELVAGNAVVESSSKKRPDVVPNSLPKLSKTYDHDIVKIWDFIMTFGSLFLDRGFMSELPTLDRLQMSIEALRHDAPREDVNRDAAISFLISLAVSLCKPLTPGITRTLFASLIALNPALQKEFGATFFNEINSADKPKDGDEKDIAAKFNLLLPVNAMTWQEIARLTFIADAFGELGYSRQETAHTMRGYRSAGHPNSKEARRIRTVEDFPIALLRHALANGNSSVVSRVKGIKGDGTYSYRMEVPCTPICKTSDWTFPLHKLVSAEAPDSPLAKECINEAISSLRSIRAPTEEYTQYMENLESCLKILDDQGDEQVNVQKAKESARSFLDRITKMPDTQKFVELSVQEESKENEGHSSPSCSHANGKPGRYCLGTLNSLILNQSEFKALTRIREEYMSDALRLKEEMRRQELKESGEDGYDDDDDDDDDEGANDNKPDEGKEKSQDAEKKGTIDDSESANQDDKPKPATKETPFDEFSGDIADAPELIRRCLAVLRTVCGTGPAEPFIYPVDPQSNPGYYDMLLRPMCMREIGTHLQKGAKEARNLSGSELETYTSAIVTEFARNVRLIGRNCLSYANAGPTIISAGEEMLRIFERLLLDWVLAPDSHLTPFENMDDDKCVDPHPSDSESTVILCDGCEGNYNIQRLEPPLFDIPKGDWFCPGCRNGRWWGDLDPRIGLYVTKENQFGKVKRCISGNPTGLNGGPTLFYEIELSDGTSDVWSLKDVDLSLEKSGQTVPPIRCLEAVAESCGYGFGASHDMKYNLVPVPLQPNVSDAAAQVALSSSVYCREIAASSAILYLDPEEMNASEWLRLLSLLSMKCASSDVVQNFATKLEGEAAEQLAKQMESMNKITKVSEVLDYVPGGRKPDKKLGEGAPTLEVPNLNGDLKATDSKSDLLGTLTRPEPAIKPEVTVQSDPMAIERNPSEDVAETEPVLSMEEQFRSERAIMLVNKQKRQKAREDGMAAFCMKNQLRSALASFEQDQVSQVIESVLSSKDQGLKFSSNRCRGLVCDFCGLSDTSLGTNLVRVPDDREWDDLIPNSFRSRKTHMIADVGAEHDDGERESRLVSLVVRVDDEIVAEDEDELYFDRIEDGGMLEFLPRNSEGYQHELAFRYDADLPFISGSLSGHESCAIAAHNARKVKVVQKFKETQAVALEREAGKICGRSLQIGTDTAGRTYWNFHSAPTTLFVHTSAGPIQTDQIGSHWQCFSDPETIASVILSLGKDSIAKDLKQAFPDADRTIRDGTWSELLLKRKFPIGDKTKDDGDDYSEGKENESEESEQEPPFANGENVLVESQCGKTLWDAVVTGVEKLSESGQILRYRVKYEGWSSRFVEWVKSSRVVEASENNRLVQEERLEDLIRSRKANHTSIENLRATEYIHSKDRARGDIELPNFDKIAETKWHATSNDRTIAAMKAALLAIEAALPIGSIENTTNGAWRPGFAQAWRSAVLMADDPWNLVRCTIILEDAVSDDWVLPEVAPLRSCLPGRWRALEDATASSVATRVLLLDKSLMYTVVDKRRYRQNRGKRN